MAGRDHDDRDKTVFGGPTPASGANADRDAWGNPTQPQQQGDDRTVIGGPGHKSPFDPNDPAGSPFVPGRDNHPGSTYPPYRQPPGGDSAWMGRPAQSGGYGQQGSSPFGGGPASIGQPAGRDQGFFPDLARADQQAAPTHSGPRIQLQNALAVRDLGAGSSSNPLLAAASSLLILLGRLRTGIVELQVAPLMDHVTREIDRFERNALTAGVNPHQALVAKYALSGTADDIVQNLPGADRSVWQQYSMVARFFHKRDSGVGFFQEAEKAMQAPAQNYNLLELMLVCLSLGFEGQFRTMPDGGVQLARIRNAIYESLRRVHPRPDEDISLMWTPVVQDRGRRFGAVPLPAVLGIAAIALLSVFAVLATLINRDGALAAETLRNLHQGAPVLQIDRSPGAAFVAEIPQLQRIRDKFADEITAGQIAVEAKGDYIAIRVGNLQLFDSGKVAVKEGFAVLAARIAQVLNEEGGPIVIEGHTDNVPMSGRGQYKDNYQLSQARAEAVANVLSPLLGNASRVTIEGRGADDPVADNATNEGKSENRRVEILLAREGSYDSASIAAAPNETETGN